MAMETEQEFITTLGYCNIDFFSANGAYSDAEYTSTRYIIEKDGRETLELYQFRQTSLTIKFSDTGLVHATGFTVLSPLFQDIEATGFIITDLSERTVTIRVVGYEAEPLTSFF